jgi:hypothetical protein
LSFIEWLLGLSLCWELEGVDRIGKGQEEDVVTTLKGSGKCRRNELFTYIGPGNMGGGATPRLDITKPAACPSSMLPDVLEFIVIAGGTHFLFCNLGLTTPIFYISASYSETTTGK